MVGALIEFVGVVMTEIIYTLPAAWPRDTSIALTAKNTDEKADYLGKYIVGLRCMGSVELAGIAQFAFAMDQTG